MKNSDNLLSKAARILPFDSGAFHNRILHPPMHEDMLLEQFELRVCSEAPMHVIEKFYNTEEDYLNIKPMGTIEGYDSYRDFTIDSYVRLLHRKDITNKEVDDRASAIEVQFSGTISISHEIQAVVLPAPYLELPGVIQQIEGEWGATALSYEVNEEFIPREVQGALFQAIRNYYKKL
jgi:hypothetical protein